jgi:uncharacterized peroxidase-related enzyme
MPRLQPVDPEKATAEQKELLDKVKQKMGKVPNILGTMANSPAALKAYLGLSEAVSEGSLPGDLRERIALLVAEVNQCHYCLAAHTMLGANAGLSSDDMLQSRKGQAPDEKTQTALDFSRKLIEEKGYVADDDVARLRKQGFGDGEVAELIAVVTLNMYTNYFNHVAETEVDFPAAPSLS